MDFENKIPEWKNEGTEPTEKLETGFTATYKPPAAFFNWFWNKVTKCINELQRIVAGLAKSDLSNVEDETFKSKVESSGIMSSFAPVNVTLTNIDEIGLEFKGTINGLDELYAGLRITVIPNTGSSAGPLLSINDSPYYDVKYRQMEFAPTSKPCMTFFFVANVPYNLTFTGNSWLLDDEMLIYLDQLEGTVLVTNGGTGATTAEQARQNLGAAPTYQYGTEELTVGESELETGTLYFVYE